MKTEQLLELIKGLSKEENKQLSLLITTKYWQLSKNYSALFLQLLSSTDNQRSKICHIEEQRSNRNFLSKRIRFASILEDFIAMIEMKKNGILKEISIANFYHKRELTKNYESKIETIQNQLEEAPIGTDTALYKFQLYEVMLSRNRMIRQPTDIPIRMHEALYQFYTDNHWRFKCEFLNQEARLNSSLSPEYKESIVSRIFQHIFELFKNKDNTSKHYLILKKQVTESSIPELDHYMIKTVLVYLMSYAAQQISHGKEDFAIDYLSYVHLSIEHDFFLENELLDYARYHNTILAYLIDDSDNIERIEEFIKDYSDNIFYKKDSELIKKLLDAYLLFFKGCYNKVGKILNSLKHTSLETIHKVFFAKLTFKVFYEQNKDYDKRFKELKRIENFVTNKTDLTPNKKEAYRSFISLSKKLINQRLTKEIILQHPKYISVLDRVWLLKKCER